MTNAALKVTLQGNPLTLAGTPLAVGASVPNSTIRSGLADKVSLAEGKGKVRIITTAPSVDTAVCAKQLRAFDERASKLSDGIEVWYVTRDLAPALDRFSKEHDIKNVRTFSDAIEQEFGEQWGLTIGELGVLARTAYVVDADGKITYREFVSEVAEEPDYDAAIKAAEAAV